MLGIERNKNPAGRAWNFAFGVAQFGDGMVRVISFGWLHTRWALDVSRLQAKYKISTLKNKA